MLGVRSFSYAHSRSWSRLSGSGAWLSSSASSRMEATSIVLPFCPSSRPGKMRTRRWRTRRTRCGASSGDSAWSERAAHTSGTRRSCSAASCVPQRTTLSLAHTRRTSPTPLPRGVGWQEAGFGTYESFNQVVRRIFSDRAKPSASSRSSLSLGCTSKSAARRASSG